MQLEGDVREQPVLPLLLDLSRQKFTGAVSFERDSVIKILYFREGDVIAASTNDDADSVEQILVNAGKISRDHARQALTKRKDNEPIWETLLTLGYVSRKEVSWARRVQLVGIIRSVAEWSDGSYSVLENYAPKRDDGSVFHLPQIAVEAIITGTDREQMQRETGGGSAVYERAAGFEDQYRDLGLNEDADRVVAQVNGRRTASELTSFSAEEPFAVFKLLRALELLELLRRVDKPEVVPEVSEPQVTPEVLAAVAERELDLAAQQPDIGDLEQEPSTSAAMSHVATTQRAWWKIALGFGVVVLLIAIAVLLLQPRDVALNEPEIGEEPKTASAPSAPFVTPPAPASVTQRPPAPPVTASQPMPTPPASASARRESAPPPQQPPAEAVREKYDVMARRFAQRHTSTPYSLQIMLVCQTSSVTRSLEIGGEKIWFIPIRFRGQPCYRVFWGSYNSRAAAEQAVAEVPGVFREGSRPVVTDVREVLKP